MYTPFGEKLMLQNRDVEALVALGISVLQSKVYLALAQIDETNTAMLSKKTKIARPEIHRVINELQNRGLVEKILDKPIRFKAVPIHEAVPNLLRQLHNERIAAHNRAMQLVAKYNTAGVKKKFLDNEPMFYLIPKRTALSRRIKKAIENARKTIDILITRKNCVHAMFDLSSSLSAALERKVKMRWIVNELLDSTAKPSLLEAMSKSSYFNLRCHPHKPTQTFGIYDRKMIIVASNPELGYAQSPALYTNAAPLVELAQNHFNILWNRATSEDCL